nr:MAG TPA: hypothetical protein [Caudoviricetes sp.]
MTSPSMSHSLIKVFNFLNELYHNLNGCQTVFDTVCLINETHS